MLFLDHIVMLLDPLPLLRVFQISGHMHPVLAARLNVKSREPDSRSAAARVLSRVAAECEHRLSGVVHAIIDIACGKRLPALHALIFNGPSPDFPEDAAPTHAALLQVRDEVFGRPSRVGSVVRGFPSSVIDLESDRVRIRASTPLE